MYHKKFFLEIVCFAFCFHKSFEYILHEVHNQGNRLLLTNFYNQLFHLHYTVWVGSFTLGRSAVQMTLGPSQLSTPP